MVVVRCLCCHCCHLLIKVNQLQLHCLSGFFMMMFDLIGYLFLGDISLLYVYHLQFSF